MTSARVLNPYADERKAHEIEVIARRWVEKIVIGLNLCPFAKAGNMERLSSLGLEGLRRL